MPARPFRTGALVVFSVALAARLIHLWNIRNAPFFSVLMGDARGYDLWAQRILTDWIGGEVFYQAPLYPYFLAALYTVFDRDLFTVRLVQALLGSASCALVALAAVRLFSQRAGWIAGLGLALYAPAIFFDGLIQKSVLDVFFVSLSLWLLSRLVTRHAAPGRLWLALGLSMGALSLTRENALLLVAVIFPFVAFRPRGTLPRRTTAAAAAFFLLGVALLLVPVAIRNNAVGGGFYVTTSQFGPNFFIGNNPRADGTYASLRFGRGAPEHERQDATELAQLATGRALTPAEVSSFWTGRALDFIRSEPLAWLTLMGRKTLLLVNRTEMLDTESQETYAEWSWPLRLTGWFMHFGVLVPLAAFGMWAAWADRRRLGVFYALTFAYAASVVAFYVFARYRFPLVPMLMIFAAWGLTETGQLFYTGAGALSEEEAPAAMPSRGQAAPRRGIGVSSRWGWGPTASGKQLAAAGMGLALILAANWPLLSKTRMKAITETNLAAALHADGRSAEAISHFEKAIALQPDYAPAYNNLGVVQRASGQPDRAMASYRKAIAVVPGYPDAHYNLANALLDQDQPGEASTHFREALRSIPGSAGAHNNLGIALAAEGKLDDAIREFEQAAGLDPESARAHKNLGGALVERNRVDEGVRHLQRASRLDPNDAGTHYDLGVVYLAAAQFPDAVVEFRWALELDPSLAPAHNNLGIALASQGFLDEAIGHWQQALKLDPAFEDPRRNIETARRATR